MVMMEHLRAEQRIASLCRNDFRIFNKMCAVRLQVSQRIERARLPDGEADIRPLP